MGEKIRFNSKARYEIQALGRSSNISSISWGDLLIQTIQISDNKYKYIIQGEMRDQAELAGLLNTVYEMHMVVLSVSYLGAEEKPSKGN